MIPNRFNYLTTPCSGFSLTPLRLFRPLGSDAMHIIKRRGEVRKMSNNSSKKLGQAIDELIEALKDLDETARPIAIKAACEHLNISLIYDQPAKTSPPLTREPLKEEANDRVDIRTLNEQKAPSNAQEMACIVALYLSEHVNENEKKDEIDTKDIEKYFKQAVYPLPKVPAQVLRNAKAAEYFDSTKRGKFKLNPVGYNLVVHILPRKSK